MLEKLKILLNESDETLLNTIIELVEAEFCEYCNREDIPDTAQNGVLINMARVQYARLDTQGLTSTTISGVSEGYDTEFYNASIIKQLNQYRKIKLL